MVTEDATNRVLEYLKKQGKANTFKLARELGIDRHKILDIIKRLEEKQAIEFKSGMIRFLKFPAKERKSEALTKRPTEVKKFPSKPKKKVEHKEARAKPSILESIKAENKRLREKLLESEAKIKTHANIKNKKIREHTEVIEEHEKTIKELRKKANIPPKVIRKTIVKKVYIPKIIKKTIIKRVPVKVNEKIREEEPKKFRLPKFNITWMKNIQKLRTPEFIKQKTDIIKPNFAELNKNIQQLHVPRILKK